MAAKISSTRRAFEQIFGLAPALPEFEQTAYGPRRRNDGLRDELKTGRLQDHTIDVALRAQEQRVAIRDELPQRLRNRDAWVQVPARAPAGEDDRLAVTQGQDQQ